MRLSVLVAAILAALLAGCAHRQAAAPAPARTAGSRSPYTRPLASLGTKFGWLSPAAQNTVLAEAGSAEIADVHKYTTANSVYYKVTFKDAEHFPPLYVAPDGSVLNPDLTVAIQAAQDSTGSNPLELVTTNDLPLNVLHAFQEHVPSLAPEAVRRETWGDHLVYVFSFKEETHQPKLYVLADGTFLVPAAPK